MQWISDYELILFDFDGLLVNTEEIHFEAYKRMCAGRGFSLPWNFNRFCLMAHYDGEKLKESIYRDLPALYQAESDWRVLYAEKKAALMQLLREGSVHLMPGAESLLNEIGRLRIPCCVVTNSSADQIALIKKQNPILQTIDHWFTRETYTEAKPNPECYLNAIRQIAPNASKIIGFEDTPRGLNALLGTSAKPILITAVDYPEIPDFLKQGVIHFSSLNAFAHFFGQFSADCKIVSDERSLLGTS